MNEELIFFLSRHIPVSKDVADAFGKIRIQNRFSKGTLLINEGEVVNKAYFVLKGCLRSYVLKDGVEKTIDFFMEEDPVLPIGYGKNVPSEQYLECLEDSVLAVCTPELETQMRAAHPHLEAICFRMFDLMTRSSQQKLADYKTLTAAERYKALIIKQPDLLQRVPQYHIASYLGIQPESLSRIRKRLSKKSGAASLS